MGQVGSIATNPHEGSRSEYLAQYVFSSFGTSVAVPHNEDHGVDFHCTLTEKIGKRSWAKASYTVQVKSQLKPWTFKSKESVKWLIEHPLPLFLGVVDKKTAVLRVYHTAPRFYARTLGHLPERMQIIPTKETVGWNTQWSGDDHKFSVAPILAIEITRLSERDYWTIARSVLEFWIESENSNLTCVRTGLFSYKMPSRYEVDKVPERSAITKQLQMNPSEELLNTAILHLSDCLQCLVNQFNSTGRLVAAVEAALLDRYLHQNFAVFSGDEDSIGMLEFFYSKLTNILPEGQQYYRFAEIDEIQKRLEGAIDAVLPSASDSDRNRPSGILVPKTEPLSFALLWLINKSAWSRLQRAQAGGNSDQSTMLDNATLAIQSAAEDGSLIMRGRREGSVSLETIDPDLLRTVAHVYWKLDHEEIWKLCVGAKDGLDGNCSPHPGERLSGSFD